MDAATWVASSDGERYGGTQYDSREEAIVGAPEELNLIPGDPFWTARVVPMSMPQVGRDSAELLLWRACAALRDECGKAADDALDCSRREIADLGEMIDAALAAWMERHGIKINCFTVDTAEQHVVPGGEARP